MSTTVYDYFGKPVQEGDVILFVEQKRYSNLTSHGFLARGVVKKISETTIYVESLPEYEVKKEAQGMRGDLMFDNSREKSTLRKQLRINDSTVILAGHMNNGIFQKGV